METENTTSTNLPGANQLGAAGASEAVGGESAQEPVIALSELKTVLGKDFKDKESALKSVKDTFSYVGKAGQIENELKELKARSTSGATVPEIAEVKSQITNLTNELWFERNPQYKVTRPLIEKLSKAEGKSINEIVDLPEFKDTFTKVQGFEQSQKLKTVLESNPRLASSSDKMQKAAEIANRRGKQAEAGELVTQAVMDAFEMN